jgi:hypothetical protein
MLRELRRYCLGRRQGKNFCASVNNSKSVDRFWDDVYSPGIVLFFLCF